MNDDILVSWLPVTQDIGGQPANVLGYKIWDMRDAAAPVQVADVAESPHTLVGFVDDTTVLYSFAVNAYNAIGDGPLSSTVVATAPSASVPEQVLGVSATIIPK